jgi:hypothetical protein
MDTPLKIVASNTMDLYYQDYRSDEDFFDLPDFVTHCGDTLTNYYLTEYKQIKAEMRADRQEEVVTFSENVLSEQVLDVKLCEGELVAKLEKPFMSFPYDEQSTGVQYVFPTKAKDCQNLERSHISKIWKFKHLPITDRVFWYVDFGEIKFYKNSIVPLNKVRVLYIPVVNKEMSVPSALIDMVTTNTVLKMKQIAAGVVINETLSRNPNKPVEAEVNKADLR